MIQNNYPVYRPYYPVGYPSRESFNYIQENIAYKKEIERLKEDKKHSDFYVTVMAISSVISAIAAFIGRRSGGKVKL